MKRRIHENIRGHGHSLIFSEFWDTRPITLSIDKMQPSVSLSTGEERYYGIGKLAELVDLYAHKRENLFSKNVRYYIDTRQNIEKGPVAKMQETLTQIAINKTTNHLEPKSLRCERMRKLTG